MVLKVFTITYHFFPTANAVFEGKVQGVVVHAKRKRRHVLFQRVMLVLTGITLN